MHGTCILHSARMVDSGSDGTDSETGKSRRCGDNHYESHRQQGCRCTHTASNTHELERSTLRLLLTTELEARVHRVNILPRARTTTTTYCLQRLRASCILYLQTVHSSRSTTFFVVFACLPRHAIGQSPAFLILPDQRHEDAPSCGRRA